MWVVLGIKEIKLRYKRTKFGQLWHVLSTSIQITLLGLIWAYLFKMPIKEFFPYLAIGKIFFEYMSHVITQGLKFYYAEKSFLLDIPCPKSVFAYANATNSFVSFLHNFIVLIIIVILFRVNVNINLIFLVPAVALIFINSIWISVLFGYMGARFRDVPPLITSLMGMIMMTTPILWKVDMLPYYLQKYMILNPFYVFIKINRDAILGYPPDFTYWCAALLVTVIGYTASFFMLKRAMYRISFWV